METLARAANRGSVSTGPYEIDNSLKLEKNNSERLTRTPSSDGNERTFTFSAWVKFSHINTGVSDWSALFSAGDQASGTPSFRIGHHTNNHLQVSFYKNGAYQGYYRTDALYRDTSAWYHYVIAVDTTQATDTNRVKIYVNGEQASVTSVVSHIAQNYDSGVNRNGVINQIGAFTNSSVFSYASEYVAETHFVDGQALAPTDFGEFDDDSGIWKPKQYTGSYGTNGFYLDYADAADLGDDESGNGNDFTENNITAADQATDTPTNNFCTINPLVNQGFSLWSLTEGGTRGANVGANCAMVGTMAVSSGKWYWEGVTTSFSGTNYWQWGVMPIDAKQGNSADSMGDAGTAWYSGDNAFYTSTSASGQSVAYNIGFTGYTAGDIWSISLNCDVSPYEMTIRINNSVPGTTANNTDRSVGTYTSARPVFPYIRLADNASDNTWHNFGNPFISNLSGGNSDANGYGDFKYAPPSGYYALCTKNLAEFG